MVTRLQICGFLLLFFVLNFGLGDETDIKVKVGQLAAANNDLAVRLYKQLIKRSSDNIFFSPLSLSMAFGMLFNGARENTAKVLRNVLGYDAVGLNSEEISRLFYHLLEQELPPADTENPAYTLEIANQLLIQDGLHLKPAYKEEVNNLFKAPVDEVNFAKNAPEIKESVNHWVDEKTHGKITKLLDSISPSTLMILLNAVYFKGFWENKFNEKLTSDEDFYNNGVKTNAKKVPFMHLKDEFQYTSTDDAEVIELPYKGNNISMLVLLPKQIDGLSAVEENLTTEKIASVRKNLREQKVVLSLPKFKVEYEKEVSEDFKALGAADVFDASKANFSGIADNGISADKVIHKAAIDVNEEGSEAAAATALVMLGAAMPLAIVPPIVFKADHPFIFAIVDNRNELIMFAGRVNGL